MEEAPHILAIPFFLKGHEIPLLHLCSYIASNIKCKITFLQVPHGKNLSPLAKSRDSLSSINFVDLPMEMPTEMPTERTIETYKLLIERFNNLQEVIYDQFMGSNVTCLLSDVLVGWGEVLAEKLGVSWVAFWTSTVTELVYYYNSPRLLSENAIKDTESIVSVPGIPDIKARDYPVLLRLIEPHYCLKIWLDCFVASVARIPFANRVLTNSNYTLENPAINSLKEAGVQVFPIGPLHLLSGAKEEDDPNEVLEWLDEQEIESVLYIAFGTTAPLLPGQIEQIALALESLNVRFLWVVRSEHVEQVPHDFMRTVRCNSHQKPTDNGNPRNRQNVVRGMLTDWVPQAKVLMHRAIGGFLTHCGWNSVLESITAGVPMITRPLNADQVLTSKLLDDWGIAVRIEQANEGVRSVVDKDEIQSAIEELMVKESGFKLRIKAKQLGKLARQAMKKEGTSYLKLKEFSEDLQLLKAG